MTTLSRPAIRLEGQQLLDFVHSNAPTKSNSEMCSMCGYPSQDVFRDALTAARLFNGEYTDANGAPTMDVDLLQHLEFTFSLSQADCVELYVKLRDELGINDLCDFNDLYAYSTAEYNWEAEFAEYWTDEVCCLYIADTHPHIVVDWQATWDCNLRHDFTTIEFDDYVIIFHNN